MNCDLVCRGFGLKPNHKKYVEGHLLLSQPTGSLEGSLVPTGLCSRSRDHALTLVTADWTEMGT